MDDNDWKVAMNSEVFRGFVTAELERMQSEELAKLAKVESDNSEDAQLQAIADFEAFAEGVRNSPKKLAVFKALQNKFANDPVYTAAVNPAFVEAVMLLKLD